MSTVSIDVHPRSTGNRPALHAVPRETQRAKLPYYDYGKLLSYNGVYNFLVGGRGLGKTYGAKRLAIKRNIERGDMFIYVRRYKEELATARDTFFADIAHEFPQWEFRANGNRFERSPASQSDAKKREWEPIGYAVALSTAQKMKSVAFPRVKIIIFDEFIIERGMVHYLPNEAALFNNFYSTVDRWMDKTTVFFLANAVSIDAPLLVEYGLIPDEHQEFIRKHDGFIVAHFPNAADFASKALQTRFGRFIEGTEYADYAVGNRFADNHAGLVGIKNPYARYLLTLELRTITVSIWYDVEDDQYFATPKRPGNEQIFTVVPTSISDDRTLLVPGDKLLARIRTATRTGRMSFENASTRNLFTDIFKQT